MPITFLANRSRPQRLGRVRLGILKESKNDAGQWVCNKCKRVTQANYVKDTPKCAVCGHQLVYPAATPYFVLKDAPELAQFCDSSEPTRLNIEFLSENPEFTFPHYLRRYTGGGVNCLGDGEKVFYRVNDQRVVDVRDGNAVKPNGKVVMEDNQPVKVVCEGSQCSFYLAGACKPTGFLRFVPTGAPRLGYYDVVCHQHAVVGIKTQLSLCNEIFHHITGIPFVLHRGEEEKLPVPGKGIMPVRTQWVEIDPDWFAENYPLRGEHRAVSAAKVQQDIVDLFGEDGNGESSAPSQVDADFTEPLFEGETGEAREEEADKVREGLRPAPAETVKEWLTKKAKKLSHYHLPTPGQLGLMNGLLSKVLGGDQERHTWLEWTWGALSSKGLSGGQVGATLSWLKPIKDTETNDYIPLDIAVSEARIMLRQALLDQGQADMFDAIHDAAEEEERAYDAILDADEKAAEGSSE